MDTAGIGAIGTQLATMITGTIDAADVYAFALPVVGALGGLVLLLSYGPEKAFGWVGRIFGSLH